MSRQTEQATAADGQITLDDLRHKALAIREDVRTEVREQVADRRNQIVLIGVLAVVAALSLAYYVGSRAGRRAILAPLE
jgi:hypothetical protein